MNKIPILINFFKLGDRVIKTINDSKEYFDVVLDSGAYSAFKASGRINIEDYMNFLDELPFDLEFYFTLDVIGNPKETLRNYITLIKKNYKPVPVFTRGESFEKFDFYYEKFDFIGIGGIAGTQNNRPYLRTLYKENIIKHHKVHWLGFWERDFLLNYHPFSCDTQSWFTASRFGRSSVFSSRRLITFTKKEYNKSIVKRFCLKYGIDNTQLKFEKNWRWDKNEMEFSLAQKIQTLAVLDYIDMIQRKFGTKIYLVCGSKAVGYDIELLIECFNLRIRSYIND